MSVGDLPGALFFYGVLRPGLASGRMAGLIALLGQDRPATVSGKLYAVPDPRGHFPVMIAATAGEQVHGTVLTPGPRFGSAELAEFDAFEGFKPNDPDKSEYRRLTLVATLPDGSATNADVYRWNRAIGGEFIPIIHGDFARYLAETGNRPLPG